MLLYNVSEMEGYKPIGEEIIVEDMHARKKMIFDKVSFFVLSVFMITLHDPLAESRVYI